MILSHEQQQPHPPSKPLLALAILGLTILLIFPQHLESFAVWLDLYLYPEDGVDQAAVAANAFVVDACSVTEFMASFSIVVLAANAAIITTGMFAAGVWF